MKTETIAAKLLDKKDYPITMRNLKQALNHGFVFVKVHRVIKFNQKAWLKSYIDINRKLRKKKKNDFGKYFFKLLNNTVFGKSIKNVRKLRDIKLVTTEYMRNYLASKPNYHTTFFLRISTSHRNGKTIFMNKPVYLGLSISELSKILMHKFFYDYVKTKYMKKKISYMDTDSFRVYKKQKTFTETFQTMSKQDVILQIKKQKKRGNNERVCSIESKNIELFN